MATSDPMTPSGDPVAADLHGRAALAHWLSGVLAGASDPTREAPPRGADGALLGTALGRMRNAIVPGDAFRQRLESERIRLFVNAPRGVPAPPYGSWWIEGTLAGESTVAVAAFYLGDGLQVDAGSGPADAIPSELEYLHFLLQHQRAARVTGQPALEAEARSREREFLGRFVVPWVSRFCDAIRGDATEAFWVALGDLLEAFLIDEARRVSDTGV